MDLIENINGIDVIGDSKWIKGSLIVDEILNGKQVELLDINIRNIVERFNYGNTTVLETEEVDKFLQMIYNPDILLTAILRAKRLFATKNKFLEIIERKKNKFNYDPDEMCAYRDGNYNDTISYKGILEAFNKAEAFINSSNTYRVLRYCLKYYSLSEDIKRIRLYFDTIEDNTENAARLYSLLKKGDHKIGLVKVDDSKEGIAVYPGTEMEIKLSNIVGHPFSADGEYYLDHLIDLSAPYCVVKKTFYKEGLTKLHKEMIAKEYQERFDILSGKDVDDVGYILFSDYVLPITKRELLEAGVNPRRVGWQPLSLSIKPIKLSSLYDIDTTLKEKLDIKTKLILK